MDRFYYLYWMDCFYGMNGECGNFAYLFVSNIKKYCYGSKISNFG